MSGWIKIDRRITDNWIFQDAEYFRAWVDLLLLAEYEEHKALIRGKLVTLERGTVYKSLQDLSCRWHWGINRTRRFLDLLEADDMIERKSATNGSTIKVRNYQLYQGFAETAAAAVDRQTDIQTDRRVDRLADNTIINIKKLKKTHNAGARVTANKFHNFEQRDTNYDEIFKEC